MIPPLDRLSRRALLKGASASLLLPFLPSLSWAEDPAVPAPKPPKRWATIIFANGVHDESWWAKGEGEAMELSPSLKPLDAHRGRFSVIDSLRIFDKVPNLGPHAPFFTNMLSGARLPGFAQSCDQLLARTIGAACAVPSLVLAAQPVGYAGGNGLPAVNDQSMSWSSSASVVPPQSSPRDAFDALFDVKGLARQKSVLDCLDGQLKDMRPELSAADRRKLDEFGDSVRDLERRIELATAPAPEGGWHPSLKEPDMPRPAQNAEQAAKLPLNVVHKLMLRIIALAFAMDKTRVATFMMEGDGSFVSMNFVPGVENIALHTLAHYENPAMATMYQLTNAYHVSQFAAFLDKLRSVDEGGSTLLDNSMVLFGSNVRTGHNGDNVPLILAGGGGGTLKPGKRLSFERTEDRRIGNLHLAMLQRMGVTIDGKPIERFYTSTTPLEGI
jgi:hypothetical protein